MFLTDLGSQIFDLDHAFRITDIAVKLQELFRDHREWAALDADDGLVQIRIDPCDGFGNEPLWELLFRLHRDDADAAVIFCPAQSGGTRGTDGKDLRADGFLSEDLRHHEMTAGGETERTFRKLRQRRCGDPFQKNRIFCGHTDDLFFAAEQDVKVILVDRGNRKDPELCNAGEKLLRLLRNAAFMDLIIDEREEAMKRLETFLDEDSRSGIGNREAQRPLAAVADISDLILGHIFQRADVFRFVVEDAACIGQDEVLAAACRDDELRAEIILQRLHLLR